jgi:hypothetical protein
MINLKKNIPFPLQVAAIDDKLSWLAALLHKKRILNILFYLLEKF